MRIKTEGCMQLRCMRKNFLKKWNSRSKRNPEKKNIAIAILVHSRIYPETNLDKKEIGTELPSFWRSFQLCFHRQDHQASAKKGHKTTSRCCPMRLDLEREALTTFASYHPPCAYPKLHPPENGFITGNIFECRFGSNEQRLQERMDNARKKHSSVSNIKGPSKLS